MPPQNIPESTKKQRTQSALLNNQFNNPDSSGLNQSPILGSLLGVRALSGI